jgi:hypothetical protein
MSMAGPLRHIKVSLEGSMATSATTDNNGYYSFSNLQAGGSYTITPRESRLTPHNRFFDNLRRDESGDFFQSDATPTPTPTPTPTVTETWTPSPSPEIKETKPECSEADQQREEQAIRQRVRAMVQPPREERRDPPRDPPRDRRDPPREPPRGREQPREQQAFLQTGAPFGQQGSVGEFEFHISWVKVCKHALVTVGFLETGGFNVFNKARKEKRFACPKKFLGQWVCFPV